MEKNMNTTLLFMIALAIMLVLIIICLILIMINSSRINTLIDYSDDGDLVSVLKEYYEKVDNLAKTINSSSDAIMSSRIAECERKSGKSFHKTATVNFDAFDDVTGKLSFALTLLNGDNDGVILTSLYGHNSCNMYVREIRGGSASTVLLDEEKQSLEAAKKSGDNNGTK